MASTTPSVSFPVRWSSFITIETREPRLILARSVPAILGNLPFFVSSQHEWDRKLVEILG